MYTVLVGLLVAFLIGLAIWGLTSARPAAVPSAPISPSAAPGESTATYRLTFNTTWNSPGSPAAAPQDAHTGNMLAVAHDARFHLFQVGQLASGGIVETSMHGTLGELQKEVSAARQQGIVGASATAGVIKAPGSQQLILQLDSKHPLVGFVTMLAPSPDWFFGIDGAQVFQNGAWLPRVEVPISVWDAGSDSGTAFANEPDYPEARRQPIALVKAPLWGSGSPQPLGTVTLERVA